MRHKFAYREEAQEFVEIGALNGLFVLGRSMGFIGESAQPPFPIILFIILASTNERIRVH